MNQLNEERHTFNITRARGSALGPCAVPFNARMGAKACPFLAGATAGILPFPEKENHGKARKTTEIEIELFSGKPRKPQKTTEMDPDFFPPQKPRTALISPGENHGNKK